MHFHAKAAVIEHQYYSDGCSMSNLTNYHTIARRSVFFFELWRTAMLTATGRGRVVKISERACKLFALTRSLFDGKLIIFICLAELICANEKNQREKKSLSVWLFVSFDILKRKRCDVNCVDGCKERQSADTVSLFLVISELSTYWSYHLPEKNITWGVCQPT